MTRSIFPRANHPVLEQKPDVFDREWIRYLREQWEIFGFSPSVPTYGGRFFDGLMMYEQTGSDILVLDASIIAPSLPSGVGSSRSGGLELPNNYRPGTNISPYAQIAPSDSGAGNVLLRFGYSLFSNGGTVTETTEDLTVAMSGTAKKPARVSFAAISGSGAVKGSFLKFWVQRRGSDGSDTYTGDMALVGFGVKFQIEGIGWETLHIT